MLHTAYTHYYRIYAIPNMANKCTQCNNITRLSQHCTILYYGFLVVVVAGKNNMNLNIIEIGQVLQWYRDEAI